MKHEAERARAWKGDPSKPCEHCGESWKQHRPAAGQDIDTYVALCRPQLVRDEAARVEEYDAFWARHEAI